MELNMEMPLRTSHRKTPDNHASSGPGGINCPCCCSWGNKSAAKRHNSRGVRRAARIAVRLNARNSED